MFGHVTHSLVTSGRVRFRERLVTFGFEWEIVCVCVCVNLSFLILLKSNMIVTLVNEASFGFKRQLIKTKMENMEFGKLLPF